MSPAGPGIAELAPRTRDQRRRVAFLLEDYVDTAAQILEIGIGDGWLGAYLMNTGFKGYRHLRSERPGDVAADIRRWRELECGRASFDLVIAFDVPHFDDCLAECYDLLVPGGFLVANAPIPGREWLARWLTALGWRRRLQAPAGRRVGALDLHGFQPVVRRRVGLVEELWRLRRPIDPARRTARY